MASDTRIPKAEITGIYGAMVKRFSKKMLGDVPEPLGVYWQNRPVLRFYLGLGQKANKWHECDKDLKSFAHMAVASLVRRHPKSRYGSRTSWLGLRRAGLQACASRPCSKWFAQGFVVYFRHPRGTPV
jgi:hypothetical protein